MPSSVGTGCAAIVIQDSHLLMIKRAGSHGAGLWSVPGGWLDVVDGVAEKPEAAAKREVFEETGIFVEPQWLSRYQVSVVTIDGVHSACIYVPCSFVRGIPQVMEPDKCPEVRWVPLEEVPRLPLFQHFAEIVKTL